MARARVLAVAATVALCALVAQRLGWLQGLDLALYDGYLRGAIAAPASGTPAPVLVVEIGEADIREQGHWPLSDRTLADALGRLADAGARVIGLDLYRDLPVAPGVASLARLLREEPRIVAVDKFGGAGEDGIPPPPALAGSDRVGFNDLIVDRDDIVRRALLFQDDGKGEVAYAFALRVALAALAAEGIAPAPDPVHPSWLRLGPTTLRPFAADDGGYAGADDAGYQMLLDYATLRPGLDRASLSALLRGEVAPERIRDRIVLVGSNAKSLPDFFPLPVGGRVPGVELHAHAAAQLVRYARGEAAPLHVLAGWQEAALVALASVLGCLLGIAALGRPLLGTTAVAAAVLGGAAALWGAGALAFRAGWWWPPAAPALAWVGSAGLATAWLSQRERAERAQLMRIFARHVSADVAAEIWRHREDFFAEGRPRPQRLAASVLFVDIKSYTPRAEKMDPQDLMDWSNAFLDAMARCVDAHGGVVDDYFGDGIKANFGVPIPRSSQAEIARDARSALECALAMADAVRDLDARNRERGLPPCRAKVGIHSGEVVAGSLGSADRLKYTVVGGVAVTAQRLESTDGVAHDYERHPCRILVSARSLELAGAGFETEPVGSVQLRGIADPLSAHRLLGRAPL